MLNDFQDEDLVLDVKGLNMDDGLLYESIYLSKVRWLIGIIWKPGSTVPLSGNSRIELLQDVYLEKEPPN